MKHEERLMIISLGAALCRAKRLTRPFSWVDAWGSDEQLLAHAVKLLEADLPTLKQECERDIAQMELQFSLSEGTPVRTEPREITCASCPSAATCPHAYDVYNAGDGTDCLASK